MSLHQLADALVHATEISRRRAADPGSYLRWLPLQAEFLASMARVKQIRAGNQTIGKTTPALAEVVGRCLGRHPLGDVPHDYRMPPIEAWVICASWSQSLGIQAKLWALLPREELADRTSYDAVSGFAPTKSPVVLFRNGSIIRIKTTGQDAIDFAGATIAVVLFDEPPKQPRTYVEALMRLEELGGVLLLSYTPINAPTDYLRKLVDEGQIEDHWRPLTPAELVPVGCTEPLRAKDGRPKDAAWIAERAAKVPEHERGVVLHGEWETRARGAYFSGVWRPDRMTIDEVSDLRQRYLILALDHGSQPGRQIAGLLSLSYDDDPEAEVVDEYVGVTGAETPADDARGILDMLGRNGLQWTDLDEARGDRLHVSGHARKSNRDLMVAICEELDLYTRDGVAALDALQPQIETAKHGENRGAGSVKVGTRWLYTQIGADRLRVHRRCKRVLGGLLQYTEADNEAKDPIDLLRYGFDRLIFRRRGGVERREVR